MRSSSLKTSLFVLQHGNAVSREVDEQRPLSDDGRAAIARLAKHLAGKSVEVRHILHSGKLRAEQTAQIISEQLAPDISPVSYDSMSPSDNPELFINGLDMAMGNILLVSHMPFVSGLCSALLSGGQSARFEFTPGTLACINFQDGAWSMAYMLRPDLI